MDKVKYNNKLLHGVENLYNAARSNKGMIYHIFPPYTPPVTRCVDPIVEHLQSVLDWNRSMSFLKYSSVARFKRTRKRKIYILPIGPFPDYFYKDNLFCFLKQNIKSFVEMFFCEMSVVYMETVDHRAINCRTRYHEKSKQKQIFLPDMNFHLNSIRPKDAFVICGFSWFDFYPEDNLNHILGEGSSYNGTVAFSFGHYAMFKEQEARYNKYEQDFVVEPCIEIDESLQYKHEMKKKVEPAYSYDYVTDSEKQEAKKQIDRTECGCQSFVKVRRTNSRSRSSSPSNSPKLRKLINRVKSLRDQVSPSSSNSNSPPLSSNEDLRSSQIIFSEMEEDRVSSLCSGLSMQAIDDKVNIDETYFKFEVNNDLCAGFEVVDSVNMSPETERKIEESNLIRSALPPMCEFKINCKLFRRLFRVISHELCHVFGLLHCQYFDCTMNTSVSVLHADTQTLLLCPVCLRKLELALKFNVLQRYRELDGFLTLRTDECCRGKFRLSKENYAINKCPFMDDRDRVRSVIDFITQR